MNKSDAFIRFFSSTIYQNSARIALLTPSQTGLNKNGKKFNYLGKH